MSDAATAGGGGGAGDGAAAAAAASDAGASTATATTAATDASGEGGAGGGAGGGASPAAPLNAADAIAASSTLKDAGNELYKAADYDAAVAKYGEGIKILKAAVAAEGGGDRAGGEGGDEGEGGGDGEPAELEREVTETAAALAVMYCNRAAAYIALKRFVPACRDAMLAAEEDGSNWKAYYRQGLALMAMTPKRFRTQQAIEAFETCLKLPSLPDSSRARVTGELRKARKRSEKQEEETPMPEACSVM